MKSDWNELEFLSWIEFKKMAPTIIRLEISRIEKIINLQETNSDFYNALIKSKFELNKFIECLEKAEQTAFDKRCIPHLQTAIVNLSLESSNLNKNIAETIDYTVDRLKYIYDRAGLIY